MREFHFRVIIGGNGCTAQGAKNHSVWCKICVSFLIVFTMMSSVEAFDHTENVQNQARAALVAWASIDHSLQPRLVEYNVARYARHKHLSITLTELKNIYENLPAEAQALVDNPGGWYSGPGAYQPDVLSHQELARWLGPALRPRGLDSPMEVRIPGKRYRRLLLYDTGSPELGGEQAQWPDDSGEAWINPPARLTLRDHYNRSILPNSLWIGEQRWLILTRPPRQWLVDRVNSIRWLEPFSSDIEVAELVTVTTPLPHLAQEATAILAREAPWIEQLEEYQQRMAAGNQIFEEWEKNYLRHLEERYERALQSIQPPIEASTDAERMVLLRSRLGRGDPEAILSDIETLRQNMGKNNLGGEQLSTEIGRQALQILIDVEWDRERLAQWSYVIPEEWYLPRIAPRQPWPDANYVEGEGAFSAINETDHP